MNNGLVPRTQRSVTLAMRSIVQLDGALQSRGPCIGGLRGLLGPGSAQQRKNAAARPGHERDACCLPHSVIASAAKQSRIFPQRQSGLLRCARNDDVDAVAHTISPNVVLAFARTTLRVAQHCRHFRTARKNKTVTVSNGY